MIIVLIGPPGAGKGTQGAFLTNALNLPHFSLGDTLRKMMTTNDEEAVLLNECMKEGKLVPSDLVNEIVKKKISQATYRQGCILDGYPRNIGQAKFLETIALDKIKVVALQIDDNVAIDRIINRFICAECNAIYNNENNFADNCCVICGSRKFVHRKDDNIEIIYERISTYKLETEPLIAYYQTKNNIFFINANQSLEAVRNDLITALKMV